MKAHTKEISTKRRTLTAEQTASRDARRAKFKALWKQVAAMPEGERIKATAALGFVTCEGHALSLCNSMLIALQLPKASVLGGFRKWLKQGRCVRKGEHGAMIWVPTGQRNSNGSPESPLNGNESPDSEGADTRFIIGTVFDIAQTDELQAEHPVASVSPEIAAEFGMANLPNTYVVENGELATA